TWESYMGGALADVPVTEFTEPAPITDLADILRRRSRGGFDVQARREAQGTDPGAYVEELPAPSVDVPPATTTTVPRGDDDEDDNDQEELDSYFDRLFPSRDRDEETGERDREGDRDRRDSG
ncbi:MAG: hypothetical protein M3535_07290, partial [Actinomycetota bacterium]|nr:hypothetical protein [Actinomycetota bacterium]